MRRALPTLLETVLLSYTPELEQGTERALFVSFGCIAARANPRRGQSNPPRGHDTNTREKGEENDAHSDGTLLTL